MLCSRKHFLTKYFLKYLENRNKYLAQFNYVCCRMYFYSRVHKDSFAAIDYRDEQVLQLYRMESWACSFVVKKKWYTFPEIFCMLIHNASQCFMELGFF